MKKIFYLYLLALSMLFLGCNGDEADETVFYKTDDVSMIDLGKISTEYSFHINQNISLDTLNCTLRTKVIKSGDVVDTITVVSTGKELRMNIITSPNDFSCNEVSCFTVHELKFKIIGLKKGKYNVSLGINNGYDKPFSFIVN